MHSFCRSFYKMYSKSNNHHQFSLGKLRTLRSENFTIAEKYFSNSITNAENTHDQILKEVSNGDEEVEYKLKVLVMEIELFRQEGELVPENNQLKAKHYIDLLKLKHKNGRRKHLEFLFKIEKKKENEMRKKKEKALLLQEHLKTKPPKDVPLEEFVQLYDLSHNNIFLRIRDKSINNLYNSKAIRAMQFGQKLIIDCGFHDKMTERENNNCAKQLMYLFGDNRMHNDPFDLHFCNYDKTSPLAHHFYKSIPTLYDPEFPLNIHQESYLDLIPKDKLVYLTPHCREEMKEYDHDVVYIIGAIVDKVNQTPLSLARAKEQNIKMAKFPLDRYLSWSGGSGKSLTLNQVLLILLDLKETGDWKYALRHVPQRKLVRDEDVLDQMTKKLLWTRRKWSPQTNLNNLGFKYNKSRNETQDFKRPKKQMSVSSSFVKK